MTRPSLDDMYMNIAREVAKRSSCKRAKVGAVAVKDGIIAEGYNGTLPGEDNCCEENGETKPEVRHAEKNIITKLAKSTNSAEGATLYLTMSPCFQCSCDLVMCGFERVVYEKKYRKTKGIELLQSQGIEVQHYGKF